MEIMVPEMILYCKYYIDYRVLKKIMYKFKINYNVVANNACFLRCLYEESDIAFIDKYSTDEKQVLIKAILNRACIINVKFEIYLLEVCDYTIEQWKIFGCNRGIPTPSYIIKHINNIIAYDDSLRNTWILSCITFF